MLTVCSRNIPGTPTQDEVGDLAGGLLIQPGKDMAVGVPGGRQRAAGAGGVVLTHPANG